MWQASEVKTLGKHVLGTKVCEIGELLSAHTQQMVIYLNTTGSLKLSLIVTWRWVMAAAGEGIGG